MGLWLRILVVAAVVTLWTLAAWKWGRWRGGCGCGGCSPRRGEGPTDSSCAQDSDRPEKADSGE